MFLLLHNSQKSIVESAKIPGVSHADALFGRPGISTIVKGTDGEKMDQVIDKVAEIPMIINTDAGVTRWINGVFLPFGKK